MSLNPQVTVTSEVTVTSDEKKKRTLTNLYNQRPTWLDLAHKRLDEAVFAAYGWKSDLSNEEILEKLLALGSLRFASGVLRKFGKGEINRMKRVAFMLEIPAKIPSRFYLLVLL